MIQAPNPESRILRYELSDFERAAIKPMLPNKTPKTRGVRHDRGRHQPAGGDGAAGAGAIVRPRSGVAVGDGWREKSVAQEASGSEPALLRRKKSPIIPSLPIGTRRHEAVLPSRFMRACAAHCA